MYAVLGATGRTGRIAVETLRSWGLPVRALVREPSRAADLAARGAEVVATDLDDDASLTAALAGVHGLYFLVVPPEGAADPVGEAVARGERVVSAAKAAGVGHVVLLSSVGAQHSSGTGPIVILHRLERALRASGLPSSFLRAAYFAENWGQVVAQVQGQGVLPSFIGAAKPVPTVDTRDIGRTAAHLLAEGPNGVQIVELAGPTDATPNDVAAAFGASLARPIQVAAYPASAARPTLASMGLPDAFAAMYGEMYEAIENGRLVFAAEPVRGRVPLTDSLRGLLQAPA